MRKVILASASPRRRELLATLGVPFDVEVSGYEEDMTLHKSPREMVKNFALEKAKAVAVRHSDVVVIGADTVVAYGKHILGKPHTPARIKEMMHLLSEKMHRVWTAYAIVDTRTSKSITRVTEAKIFFKKLSSREINEYASRAESLDCAGGYAIQGAARAFVKRIDGDYNAIVGLPLASLSEDLVKCGVQF